MRKLLMVLVLAGCTHARAFTGPDGARWVEVRCGGCLQGFGDCMEAAREKCGGGNFDVVQQDSHTDYVGSYSANRYGANGSVTPVEKRSMMVRCR